MITYAQLVDGVPLRVGRGKVVPDGFVVVPEGINVADLQHLWLDGDEWVARPTLADPVIAPASPGIVITFPDCPADTAFEVSDEATGIIWAEGVDTGYVEIALPDAGGYIVRVTPPLPFMPAVHQIEVAP